MNKVVYLDTETTGFKPGQICELSMIVEDNYRFQYAKNYFFSVNYMNKQAEKVHGFSKEMLYDLSGGHGFVDYADEISGILKDCVLVAHNELFDAKFLRVELNRCGLALRNKSKLCTMEHFRDILKLPEQYYNRGYKNPKLSEVIEFLNIDENRVLELCRNIFYSPNIGFHDSRFDTTAMYVAVNVQRDIVNGTSYWINNYVSK